jgi:Ca2+-binding EF-hand superfamily protein
MQSLDEDHDGFVDIDELRDDMATVLKGETRTPEDLMEETDACLLPIKVPQGENNLIQ